MQTPPDGTIFEIDTYTMSSVRKNAILYVPKGTIAKYSTTGEWKMFENIFEFNPSTGISVPTTGNGVKKVSRYSLDGHSLSNPTNGVNIVKYSDGTVKKVVVK